ncbi:MAG: hypothetical protein EU539_04245 [Promethearchaeota archaeon]|nr:MAG: hypothetical protein EU539_04245 [Candidatus Lokiarchaeota archaeon]
MKKIVDVCTRIEGHGQVGILLENQNEDISYADFELDIYRGFENILIRKQLFDIPKISSRICGLCHASQSIASCKAIESLFGIEPPEQSIFLRRLMMTGELIKSHSMHLFFQSFPDLLKIFKFKKEIPTFYELLNYNAQLTSKFYELIKIGNEIDEIFGKRNVHSISSIPGGVIYSPSRKSITIAQKYLQKAQENLEWIIERTIKMFSELSPPKGFELPDPTFLGLQDDTIYDRYTGRLAVKQSDSNLINFSQQEYSEYFDREQDLRGITFFKNKNVLVGALSRFHVTKKYDVDEVRNYLSNFGKEWNNNLLFNNFLQLIEAYVETCRSLEILDDPVLDKRIKLQSATSIKNTEGIGLVEAPRGTLLHHYSLDKDDSIARVKLFVATEINLPIINTMMTNYARKLYEKNDINYVKREIQMVIRAFDPCVSCATH